MRVLKFGGAALADAAGLRTVAGIVARAPRPAVVVVSALSGVTDDLLNLQRAAQQGTSAWAEGVQRLRGRHQAILAELAPQDAGAVQAVHDLMERLGRLLQGITYTQEATPRVHDLVQSHGERLAVVVVAAALRQHGVAAAAFDAEAAGVRSQGPFRNARPDTVGLRDHAGRILGQALAAGQVPVVTGYYGVDGQGQATLFGRGGSDFVAALLAQALDAERLELWKDVPGFLTADPRAVAGATLVPRLGYDEAAELASFGAKVLHPRTVEPVQAAGIPIHVRCVTAPDAPGSVIGPDPGRAEGLVRNIAATAGLGILRLNGPGMAYTPGVAKRVFANLAEAGINVINMATSQASFALLMEEGDLAAAQQSLAALQGAVFQDLEVLPRRGLVCVVGRGLGETPGSAARILGAVAAAGVNVEMISLGASAIAIDFVVEQAQWLQAVRAVHDAFHGALPATTR